MNNLNWFSFSFCLASGTKLCTYLLSLLARLIFRITSLCSLIHLCAALTHFTHSLHSITTLRLLILKIFFAMSLRDHIEHACDDGDIFFNRRDSTTDQKASQTTRKLAKTIFQNFVLPKNLEDRRLPLPSFTLFQSDIAAVSIFTRKYAQSANYNGTGNYDSILSLPSPK